MADRIAALRVVTTAEEPSIAALAAAANSLAAGHGASGDVVGLAVRLLVGDARDRLGSVAEREVTLEALVDGTEIEFRVVDRGEPISGALASLLGLAELGLITSTDGTIADLANVRSVRVGLPAHSDAIDTTGVEVLDTDAPPLDDPVTIRRVEPDDAEALVRCVYRTYGWTYPASDMYYPGRVAAMYASGKRGGFAAFAPDGEIVAHVGYKAVTDGIVESGAAITDPRFRRRGLLTQLAPFMRELTAGLGVMGRLSQPVLTHTATQEMSLRSGAQLVGFNLHAVAPFRQAGIIDGVSSARQSFAVTYRPSRPLDPVTLYVPAPYESIARYVVEPTGWPREFGKPRLASAAPSHGTASTTYDVENQVGEIEVSVVGDDLIDMVDEAIDQFRRAGAQIVRVVLPAEQPALGSLGAGLDGLGLSFSHLVPRFGPLGDVLVLQWLAEREVDTSEWHLLEGAVTEMATRIVAQANAVGEAGAALRRREARRQRLLSVLPSDES